MTGVVHSGLVGSTPVTIASGAASIQLAEGPDYDLFITAFPVKVVGISLTINARLTLPPGTLENLYIHPFSPVTLGPTTTSVVYSDGTNSTTLAFQTRSLTAEIKTGTTIQKSASAHWRLGPQTDVVGLARFRMVNEELLFAA
jgi:hypothetical protein